jgi:hypothetical protein
MSGIDTSVQLPQIEQESPQTARSGNPRATCERACAASSGQCGDEHSRPGQAPTPPETRHRAFYIPFLMRADASSTRSKTKSFNAIQPAITSSSDLPNIW